jgi:hypothetical protein
MTSEYTSAVSCEPEPGDYIIVLCADGSPLESAQLSTSAFLTMLCNNAVRLSLLGMEVPISPSQFAAICKLTNLERLDIWGLEDEVC